MTIIIPESEICYNIIKLAESIVKWNALKSILYYRGYWVNYYKID